MSGFFAYAEAFNQPLENWDVSGVTDMSGMFSGAAKFNQPLEKWDVSNVTNMTEMFKDAKSFNDYPESWIVPKDRSKNMFKGTKVEELAKEKPLKTR